MISKPLFQIEVLFVTGIQHEAFSHLFKNPAVFVDVLLPPRNSDDCRRFFVKAHRDVRSLQRPEYSVEECTVISSKSSAMIFRAAS